MGIDDGTRPYYGLPVPMINADFIADNLIFVSVFHRPTMTHNHMMFNYVKKEVVGGPVSISMSGQPLNFPHDVYYDHRRDLIHCFFRKG